MNEIVEVFDSDTKIRFFERDGELLCPAIDLAKALGYAHPEKAAANLINRNPEHFEGFKGSLNLRTPGGMQELTVLTEEGVYVFLFLSKKPAAIQFKRKVAKFLKQYRLQKLKEKELQLAFKETELEAARLEADYQFWRAEQLANQLPISQEQLEVIEEEILEAAKVIFYLRDPFLPSTTIEDTIDAVRKSLCRKFGVTHPKKLRQKQFFRAVDFLQRTREKARILV